MPAGQPSKDLNELIDKLSDLGLFVVPVGELEGFAKEIGGHGPKWTIRALEVNVHKGEVRSFLAEVFESKTIQSKSRAKL